MARNLHLAKSILDAGSSYLVQHLNEQRGRGWPYGVPGRPAVNVQNWIDCGCGLSLDRGHNAAINILKRAGQVSWGISSPVGGLLQEAGPF